MAQFLEEPQFAHRDGVAQVEVGGGGVVPAVDPQGTALLQALPQFLGHPFFDLIIAKFGPVHQQGNLFVYGQRLHGWLLGERIQGCKGARIQGYKGARVQGYKVQGYRVQG
jgi:hypothetical protein